MDNLEFTIKILDKLGIFWDDLAYNKLNKVSYGDLVFAILEYQSVAKSAQYLGITNRTLERVLPEAFHSLLRKDASNATPWRHTLLALINIRYCTFCKSFKDITKDYYYHHFIKCKECNLIESRNRSKESAKVTRRKYYLNNLGKERARLSYNRAARKQRNVSWADKDKLKEIYSNCPEGFHVDHIIPLQGELVSGLHTPENLQYLTPTDNIRKGNKYCIE